MIHSPCKHPLTACGTSVVNLRSNFFITMATIMYISVSAKYLPKSKHLYSMSHLFKFLIIVFKYFSTEEGRKCLTKRCNKIITQGPVLQEYKCMKLAGRKHPDCLAYSYKYLSIHHVQSWQSWILFLFLPVSVFKHAFSLGITNIQFSVVS